MSTPPPPRRIRPIAIGLVWKDRSLLVEHGFDRVRDQHFFRPPGGGIEFGERALDALRREFLEELQLELSAPRLVTVVENLFDYEGQPFHEIVFVFEAQLADRGMYDRTEFTVVEPGLRTTATWQPLADLAAGGRPLYPAGLLPLLMRSTGS